MDENGRAILRAAAGLGAGRAESAGVVTPARHSMGLALVLAFFACTRTGLTTVEAAADQAVAQGCDLIFLPTDPALAPLCVGIADVVAAGAALGLDLLGGPGAGASDGGPTGAARVLGVRDSVTNARVYAWLVTHGAVKLGG